MPDSSRPRLARALYHAGSLTVVLVAAAQLWSMDHDPSLLVLLGASTAVLLGGLSMRVEDVRSGARAASLSMHAAVAILVLYLVGPWICAAACVIASVVYDVGRRRSIGQLLGNLPTRTVPIAVAGLCWTALASHGSGAIALPQDYVPLLASAFAFALAHELCFAWDTASRGDTTSWRSALEPLRANLRTTGLECLVGAGVAALCMENPWAGPVVLPLAGSMYLALARQTRVQEITERALDTFATIVDERDRYTFEHSDRVCDYSMRIGRKLGLTERQLAGLYWTSRLHDLGKVAVDNAILNKPGRLDDAEFAIMRSHPEVSARILSSFSFDAYDSDVVRYHHERYDGRGYLGKDCEDVPIEAYIIAVADAFDAMTTDRPYRAALSDEEAFEEIARGSGTHFHPEPAYAFLALMGYDFERALERLDEETPAAPAAKASHTARRFRADVGDDIRDVA